MSTWLDLPRPTALTWERLVLVGGVLCVPLPILAFYGLRGAGLAPGVCEDLVTVLVMVPLGGPHVVATFGRTLFRRDFWRRDPGVAIASAAVLLTVITVATASIFGSVRLAGAPPMQFLLTGFFFWAGLHVLQQHCFVGACLERRGTGRRQPWVHWSGRLAMLTSLYPVSLFRMSMIGSAPGGAVVADPDALATRIVGALGGSAAFADEYVFRIGRAAPILPGFLQHPALWIGVMALFAASFAAFAVGALRERRRHAAWPATAPLVAAVSITCLLVPLAPNLDSAFQGINAWHALQYLGLVWMLHDDTRSAGRTGGAVDAWRLHRDVGAAAAYRHSVLLTLGLVVAMLLLAAVLVGAGSGRFSFFGHDVAPDTAGLVPYRPGAVLTSYYLLGFGFLLVHYLQDSVDFVRRRAA